MTNSQLTQFTTHITLRHIYNVNNVNITFVYNLAICARIYRYIINAWTCIPSGPIHRVPVHPTLVDIGICVSTSDTYIFITLFEFCFVLLSIYSQIVHMHGMCTCTVHVSHRRNTTDLCVVLNSSLTQTDTQNQSGCPKQCIWDYYILLIDSYWTENKKYCIPYERNT